MGRLKAYEGDKITVLFDAQRCIHAAECVRGLPEVFDPKSRPWVQPDKADVEGLAAVVARCPTGALSYTRKDEGADEEVPGHTVVQVVADGPLYVRGRIDYEVQGQPYAEPRAALCRCGLSKNRPFCDNQHKKQGWTDGGACVAKDVADALGTGPCALQPFPGGPIQVDGPLEILGVDGEVLFRGEQQWLCRCGASQNKPFCDGSHKAAGFEG